MRVFVSAAVRRFFFSQSLVSFVSFLSFSSSVILLSHPRRVTPPTPVSPGQPPPGRSFPHFLAFLVGFRGTPYFVVSHFCSRSSRLSRVCVCCSFRWVFGLWSPPSYTPPAPKAKSPFGGRAFCRACSLVFLSFDFYSLLRLTPSFFVSFFFFVSFCFVSCFHSFSLSQLL